MCVCTCLRVYVCALHRSVCVRVCVCVGVCVCVSWRVCMCVFISSVQMGGRVALAAK